MSTQGKLLVNGDYPLIASPTLAQAYGLAAATFLQKLHYCLQSNDARIHRGRKYWFHTYQQWQETLGFYSISTIKRVVNQLKSTGILIVEKLSQSKWLRTNYYSINYHKLKQAITTSSPENLEKTTVDQQATTVTSMNGQPAGKDEVKACVAKQDLTVARESLPKSVYTPPQLNLEGLIHPLTPSAPAHVLQTMSLQTKSFYNALRQQKVDIHYDDARIEEWLKYRNYILQHIAYLKQCGHGQQRYQWHSPEQLQLDRLKLGSGN